MERGLLMSVRSAALFVFVSTFAPLCAAGETPSSFPTLVNYYHAADAALIAKRAYVEPPRVDDDETVTEVVQVLRNPLNSIVPGSRIAIRGGIPSTPDKLVLVLGSRADNKTYHNLGSMYWCGTCRGSMSKPVYDGIHWDAWVLDMTPAAIEFVAGSPPPALAVEKRLEYFVRFLEANDAIVAREAFTEISYAVGTGTYRPVANLRPEKIRKWILDPQTPAVRQGVYGVMLGMCGGSGDATALETIIADPNADPDRRIGIEGVMVGFLLLEGERGLKSLEMRILTDPKSSEYDAYSLYLAIRYMRRHASGKIQPERLNAAMRLMLDRPGMEEAAISYFASAKDWTLRKVLMDRYGAGTFDDKSIKRAVIRYLIASTKDVPKDASEPLPLHASDGAQFLEQLRRTDSKLVAETERFFFLQ